MKFPGMSVTGEVLDRKMSKWTPLQASTNSQSRLTTQGNSGSQLAVRSPPEAGGVESSGDVGVEERFAAAQFDPGQAQRPGLVQNRLKELQV